MRGRDHRFLDELSPLVEEFMIQDVFPGAVIGFDTGTSRYTRAWGYAHKSHTKMRETLYFDIASVTKLFTAAAVFRLMDSGQLYEHTKILSLLPWSDPIVRSALSETDVGSLLTHHSGLRAWYPLYTRAGDDVEKILSDLLGERVPAREMVYSDLNFILLGIILEHLTGQRLDRAIRSLVLDPLHLAQTTYTPDPAHCVPTETGNTIEKGMVSDLGLTYTGWRPDEAIRGQCNDGNAFYYFHGLAGHAGLFSTAEDLLTFGRAFCTPQSTFLSRSLMEKVLTERGGDRLYGFQCGNLYPSGGFGHTGFTGTYLYMQPELGIVITVLTSRLQNTPPGNLNRFRTEVVKALLAQVVTGGQGTSRHRV